MRGVSKFCKQPFERTESVRTIAPFWGGKIYGVDVLLNDANCGNNALQTNRVDQISKEIQIIYIKRRSITVYL